MQLSAHRATPSLTRLGLIAGLLLPCAAEVAAQESRYPWDAPAVLLEVDDAPYRATLDFDGDGWIDLVSAQVRSDGNQYRVAAWRNDQSGGFVEHWTSEASTPIGTLDNEYARVAAGDLNGDGREDFVLAMGRGTITFTAVPGGFTSQLDTQSVKVHDVAVGQSDADSIGDLWVLEEGHLRAYLSSGSTASTVNLDQATRLVVIDTDGDPQDDVATVRPNDGLVRTYALEGQLLAAGPVHQVQAATWNLHVDGGDIDGDGDDDIVAFASGEYEVLRRQDANTFVLEPLTVGGPAEFLADIDGDGDLDGVCCGGGGGTPPAPSYAGIGFSSTFEFAINDGQGHFAESFSFPGQGSQSAAGVADFDNDGDNDMAAGRTVYYNRGDFSELSLPRQFGAWPKEGVDIDMDGDPDDTFNLVGDWVYLNDGTGQTTLFAMVAPPDPPGSTITWPHYSGDFDGDGDTDLIALERQGLTTVGHVLFKNNGGGGLEDGVYAGPPGVSFAANISPYSPFTTDIDGDGDIDIVHRTGFQTPYATELWVNDGSGYFQPGPTLQGERAEHFGDLDGDGWNDILVRVPVPGGNKLALRRGLPGPDFGPIEDVMGFHLLGHPHWPIHVEDLNEDGAPDVSFVDHLGTPVFLFNPEPLNGGSVWIVATPLAGGPLLDTDDGWPEARPVDANGDGLVDIVTGPLQGSGGAAVFLRSSGSGAVLAPTHYEEASEQLISGLNALDVDGDGDIDFGAAYIHRNVLHSGETGGFRLQYGAGTPGTGGMIPTLGAAGPFRLGETPEIRLTGAVGGTLSSLAVGTSASELAGFPFPSTTVYVDPLGATFVVIPVPVGGPAGEVGKGSWALPVSVTANMAAATSFYHQAFVLDLGAADFFSATNGLEIDYGG